MLLRFRWKASSKLYPTIGKTSLSIKLYILGHLTSVDVLCKVQTAPAEYLVEKLHEYGRAKS